MTNPDFDCLLSSRLIHRKEYLFAHTEHPNINPHPDPIFLHYGMPHNGFFPIDNINFDIVKEPFETFNNPNSKLQSITIPRVRSHKNQLDLSESLQYGNDYGYPQFNEVLKELASKTHLPGFDDWDVVCSFGTGDAVYKVFDLFLDLNDSCLVEQYTFVPTLSSITCFGANVIPIKLDFYKDGIDVPYLEDLLKNWSKYHPNKNFPKCLYTIPSGQNPIGTTQSLETRKKIYEICDFYNIIIIEDDPYSYLSLSKLNEPIPFDENLSINDYLTKYVPKSYVEIDTKGRVIRLDSFSKTLAPGLRLGMIIGKKSFIEKIKLFIAVSCKQPSGVSQAIFYNYYKSIGGFNGWIDWLIKISKEYSIRKNSFLKNLYESEPFGSKKIHILEPTHGMFVTVQFNFKKDTDIPKAVNDLEKIGLEQGVIFVLGTKLSVDEESKKSANFVRLALSPTENDKELTEAANRFIKVCEIYFKYYE